MRVRSQETYLTVLWLFIPARTGSVKSGAQKPLIPTVELVTVAYRTPFRFPDFISLPYIQPIVDSAMDYLNRTYNETVKFQHSYALNPVPTDCAVLKDETSYLLSRHVLQNQRDRDATVLLSWACDNPLVVNELAREWNYLFLTSVVADKTAANRVISPTWITTTLSSIPNYIHLYVTLFARFSWTFIFMLLDVRSQPVFSTLYDVLYGVLITSPKITVNRMKVNEKPNDGFPLQQFRTVSRILVFFGKGPVLRDILIQAARENMTNGEYVYIALQVFRDYTFGSYHWQNGDLNDNVTREAFRSVLLLGMPDEQEIHDDESLTKEIDSWPRLTCEKYKQNDTHYDKANAYLVGLYSSFLMVGMALNETISTGSLTDITDGRALALRFLNRTFSIQTGRIYIDETGQRRVDLAISNINHSTGDYQVAILQHGEGWTWETINAIQWKGGQVPSNEPFCGYLHEKCRESSAINGNIIAGLSAAACVIFIGMLIFWRHLQNINLDDQWWQLTSENLMTVTVTVLSRHLLRSVLDEEYARRRSSHLTNCTIKTAHQIAEQHGKKPLKHSN